MDRLAKARRYSDNLDGGDSSNKTKSIPQIKSAPKISAHTIQAPASNGPPSHLVDILKTALEDSDVAKWLGSQPVGTKDELWNKLLDAFGKAANAKFS